MDKVAAPRYSCVVQTKETLRPIPSQCPVPGRGTCWGDVCHRWRPGNLCSHPDAGKPGAGEPVRRRWWQSLYDWFDEKVLGYGSDSSGGGGL